MAWLVAASVFLVVAVTGARKILYLGQGYVPEGKSPARAAPTRLCPQGSSFPSVQPH